MLSVDPERETALTETFWVVCADVSVAPLPASSEKTIAATMAALAIAFPFSLSIGAYTKPADFGLRVLLLHTRLEITDDFHYFLGAVSCNKLHFLRFSVEKCYDVQ
jgi:hypothetical protein